MQVFNKVGQLTKYALLLWVILGYAAISVHAGENKAVTIVLGDEGPGGCELLGKVKGTSKEDENDKGDAPYTERLIKARKNLVAEAQKLGGDNVHVIHSNNTGRYEFPGMDKEIVFVGNVYRCE